jgi:hypothetical protein
VTRGPLGVFRALALIAVVTGAAGSIGLMLFAGSRQRSLVLIGLFTGWVLSPFVALAWAGIVSKGWPSSTRTALYGLMLLLTLLSLGMYDGILPMPPGSKPAAVFLMVPVGSWLLIAIAAFAGRR